MRMQICRSLFHRRPGSQRGDTFRIREVCGGLLRRYGVWGDWEQPYLTLEPKYEAAQLRVFAKLVAAGHIYRGRKPVHWSPSSATALAEAELEYPEGHTSRSIYVAMPLVSLGALLNCLPCHNDESRQCPHQYVNLLQSWSHEIPVSDTSCTRITYTVTG